MRAKYRVTGQGQNHSLLFSQVRICQTEESRFFGISKENVFRIALLIGVLFLVALAAWATFRLHKIADYKVCFVVRYIQWFH